MENRTQSTLSFNLDAQLDKRQRLLSTHQGFYFIGFNRYTAGDQFTALGRDHGIVFDSNANVVEALGHTWCRSDVNARLNGEHHAGAQNAAGAVFDELAA